jgi:hypothetical protein
LAFDKRALFDYGGRPVIYGDKDLLTRLGDEDKYLWVRYDPIPTEIVFGNYPIDWTHEREWRTRVRQHRVHGWGLTPDGGGPLLLPPVFVNGDRIIPLPKILVRTLTEAEQLRKFLAGLSKCDDSVKGFIRQLYDRFSELKIIPLEVVSERLNAGDDRWARLETLPADEIPLE